MMRSLEYKHSLLQPLSSLIGIFIFDRTSDIYSIHFRLAEANYLVYDMSKSTQEIKHLNSGMIFRTVAISISVRYEVASIYIFEFRQFLLPIMSRDRVMGFKVVYLETIVLQRYPIGTHVIIFALASWKFPPLPASDDTFVSSNL